jgi:predicted PurR-regulated permease PerM
MEDNKVVTFSSGLIAVFIVGVVLRLAKSVLFPFFLALFIYFILSPVIGFMIKKLKLSKTISLVIVLILTFFALYLTGAVMYSSGVTLANELPAYSSKLSSLLEEFQDWLNLPKTQLDPLSWIKGLDIAKVGGFVLTSLGTFFGFVSNILLILVFLVFMLAGRGKLNVKLKATYSADRSRQLVHVMDKIEREVEKYLALKTVISVLSGLVAWIIMAAFGVDFAALFGIVTFLLNYIPNIGSFIAKVLPFVIAILQFESPWKAVWMLVLLLITDGIIGMIVEPRMMGKQLGLSPLAILFALFFWGWLWGIPGMIMAVPIIAVIKIVAENVPSLKILEALLGK